MIGVFGAAAGLVVADKLGKAMDEACRKRGAMYAPDPWGVARYRWYDGKQWTRHTSNRDH